MKAELRREEIIKVSTRIFSRYGYHDTHIETVIKEAKIGKGTFYRYFKNKEDLFVSLLRSSLNKWEKEVFIDPPSFTPDNIFEQFRQLTNRSFQFFKRHDDFCNIYLKIGPGLNDHFQPYMDSLEKQWIIYIKKYLGAAKELGYVRPDLNIEITSNIIAGGFFRVAYSCFVMHKTKSTRIDELTEEFFNTVMSGVLISLIPHHGSSA